MSLESMQAIAGRLRPRGRARSASVTAIAEVPFGTELCVRHYRLGNGLDMMVLVDRSAPVVGYHTWFRVGSRHEKPGKTGLAHLFEHLMFNETENLPAGEFDRRFEAAGGETNAATWVDWTFYYVNLPKTELPLAVELEAERMARLVLREPQVTSEKEVVANERRYRVDDDVDGAANEQLYARAFRRHPYHWPTIGWMKDIESFTVRDCRTFYETYYAPNNATVVVAGDVDEVEVLSLMQQHYGGLRASRLPLEATTLEPVQRRERRHVMRLPTATEKVHLGYHAPAFGEYDWSVLAVANEILCGGRSSRLFRRLVTDEERASDVSASVAPFRDPGLYEIWASARTGHNAAELLRVIDQELLKLARKPVEPAELEKAKNRLELSFLGGMETASGKAEQIGFYATVLGDPHRVFSRIDEYRGVTADEIQDAVRAYLVPARRTVVVTRASGKDR